MIQHQNQAWCSTTLNPEDGKEHLELIVFKEAGAFDSNYIRIQNL